ncbi:D-alanyl-D-alanine carboxypeptidase [Microbacterium sp. AK009]|uniref:M15 family metallopeptidase n=1 Tax=Microbacterium sp. AK009 TaxID=2723068 RepID=UPI0015CBED48|nr:M15 family metallopeptidase [Microbacterium sp. AK009]NYF18286.1 D-alanyl-D-alanine carboxypeptidase [Microbacterium sp. AK009]
MQAPVPHTLPLTRREARERARVHDAAPARAGEAVPARADEAMRARADEVPARVGDVPRARPDEALPARAREALRAPRDKTQPTRRDQAALTRRASSLGGPGVPLAQHARRRRRRWPSVPVAAALVAVFVLGSSASVTAAVTRLTPEAPPPAVAAPEPSESPVPLSAFIEPATADPAPPPLAPVPATDLPVVEQQVAGQDLCADPAVTSALAAQDEAAVIAAVGGIDPFRQTVVTGTAPCLRLDDPNLSWVVVNKIRPFAPIDWAPGSVVFPEGVRNLGEGALAPEAAAALTAMVSAAAAAGVGEIGLQSAYRSYTTQQTSYSVQVADRGVEGADLVSARPGHSEHQSGLAADVVPCADGSCGTLDDLAATPQGAWVAEHAWEFGWIVRYQEGRTDVTGYAPEPWHLRYVGPEIAAAMREGGYTTLEEFFALPAAPTYAPAG